MSLLSILISPFNLLFLIIIGGLAVGKIRIYRISLGIAGVLFASILVGILMSLIISETKSAIISNTQNTINIFSKLGSFLFVSVIGLQTGFAIKNNSEGSLLSFLIGVAMSACGVTVMLIISALDKSISHTTLLGILCGALTSTPALSSVCELIGADSGEAVWGYGCSYFLGVILVVLFAQLLTPKQICDSPSSSPKSLETSKIYPELMLICFTALAGNIIGNISIFDISLGITTCTLFVGLSAGYIVKRILPNMQIASQILNSFRSLGLALFFAGTGFSTGIQSVSLNIATVIYGGSITFTSILCGVFLCKLVFLRRQLNTACIISGGMTSSPAYAAISTQVSENCLNHFSFAYFGALLSLVVFIQILVD